MNKRLSFIVSLSLFNLISTQLFAVMPKKKSLNLVMLFEQGGRSSTEASIRFYCDPDAILYQLANVIEQSLPLLASTSLLYYLALLMRDPTSEEALKELDEIEAEKPSFLKGWGRLCSKEERIDKDKCVEHFKRFKTPKERAKDQAANLKFNIPAKIKENYNIYLSKDKNFTLLIPQNMDPAEFGFELSNLSMIDAKNFETIFKDMQYHKTPININNLTSMFNPKNDTPKRIYLSGHGARPKEDPFLPTKFSFAQMTSDQYREFLVLLNSIGCQFLAVLTCYGGGINLVDAHKTWLNDNAKVLFDIKRILFPIIVLSLGDYPTYAPDPKEGELLNLASFFDGLNEYFEGKKKIQDVIKPIQSKKLLAQPSIRCPGINEFFKPVIYDNLVEPFTMFRHQAYLVGQKLKYGENEYKKFKPFNFTKKNILLYPPHIIIPIKFEAGFKQIIPMIAGRAMHVFEKIEASNLDIAELFDSLIFQPYILRDKQVVIMVKELLCKNNKRFGIVPKTDSDKLVLKDVVLGYGFTDVSFGIHYFDDKGKIVDVGLTENPVVLFRVINDALSYDKSFYGENPYYGWQCKKEFSTLPKKNPQLFPQEKSMKFKKKMLEEAMPSDEAIRYATKGMQNLETLKQAINSPCLYEQ